MTNSTPPTDNAGETRDGLSEKSRALIERVMGVPLRQYGPHDVTTISMSQLSNLLDVAAAPQPETAGEDAPVAWPNDKPPPHWTPADKYDRHPKTVEEWDWRADGTEEGRFNRMIRRLNFAGDMADPRAPDQMALVLRTDLIDIKHKLIRAMALNDLYKGREAIRDAIAAPTQQAVVSEGMVEALREIAEWADQAINANGGIVTIRRCEDISDAINAMLRAMPALPPSSAGEA